MDSSAKEVIDSAINQGRFVLTESETKELCESVGLPVIKGFIAKNENDAVQIANKIGYPVALKISSPDILHKSDAEGVVLNMWQDEDVQDAYRMIIENAKQHKADADILGVLVQKIAKPDGKEVIIGVTTNKQFGKVVMFGLGGIFVEVLKDVAFRVAPVDKETAIEMIKEIQGYDILRGIRSEPASDIDTIATIIEKISQLVTEFPEIDELDLNPIFVYEKEKGAIIVDARTTLTKEKPEEKFRYSPEEIVSQMTRIFRPKAVAVIGASSTPGKIGYAVTKNLLDGGYQGKIYPIHPKAEEVLGLKVYPTIADVPGQVDVGVVCIPARFVPDLISELGQAKVAGAILIPSGFAEIGNQELQKQVVEAGKTHRVRLMGPNIYGYYYTPEKLCATFCTPYTLQGKVALSSQSGGIGMSIIGYSRSKKIGVSAIVGLGNKSDIDEDDLIEFFEQDKNTEVIAMHVEDLKDGQAFMEAAKKCSKPIIVLKAGRTELGERAATSHTGALAGTDAIYNAAFMQCGVIRAKTLYELLDWSRALQMLPTPKGENVVIITGAGGSGVLLADACADHGLKLMEIPPDLDKAFKEHIPPFGASGNPIDITGGEPPETYYNAIKLGLTDNRVHALILGYWHTLITPPMAFAEVVAKVVDEAKQEGIVKPIVCSLVGDVEVEMASLYLEERGILAYPYTMDAPVSALAAKYQWARSAGKIS
ncbi:MAG: acetate--CoA ligase family protein [Promethearchaeota archaeon]